MISIVIPVFNAEKTLSQCVDSVLRQSYTDWELILVDDGSKDSSWKLCKGFEKNDKRVKAFHKENGGPASARNVGLKNAKGEYILFVDSDDAIAQDSLRKLVLALEKHNADCIVFGIKQLSGLTWAPAESRFHCSQADFKDQFYQYLNQELLSPVVNKLFKKSLIRSGFPEDMDYGEDLVFSLQYLRNCSSVEFIPDLLYLHNNINTASLTHTVKLGRLPQIEKIGNLTADIGGTKDNKTEYQKYFNDVKRYIMQLLLFRGICNSLKKEEIRSWINNSTFDSLVLSEFDLSWKESIVLSLIKRRSFFLLFSLFRAKSLIKK